MSLFADFVVVAFFTGLDSGSTALLLFALVGSTADDFGATADDADADAGDTDSVGSSAVTLFLLFFLDDFFFPEPIV